MEDLVKRSAASSAGSGSVGDVGKSGGDGGTIWQEVANGDGLGIFSGTVLVTALALGGVVGLLCLICSCCLNKKNERNSHKKKKHLFGIKKTGYFRDKMMSKPRNPAPVINPDKGSHYLKKSPSPTDAKSPPGGSMSHHDHKITTNEHKPTSRSVSPSFAGESRKNSMTPTPTAAPSAAAFLETNELAHASDLRRSSSGLELDQIPQECAINTQLGTLHCTIKYDFDKNALIVTINKCVNLPAKDTTAKSSDPYVKLQLLPEKQHKVKTRVMRRTLSPCYDEDFTFYGVHFNQLPGLTLHFVVLSFDRYSRDDVIGEVMVELEPIDLSSSDHQPVSIAREITPRSFKLKTQGRGEILVSLCYQPAANRITAVVLKARNLPKMDITGLSDPYVKIYLLYNEQRIAKKKTHVKKRTLNPVFNESFVFDLPNLDDQGLKNISLEFLLLDWDRVTKNEVIGRLDLGGPNCTGSALNHWNEVVTSPRRQIAEWHKLQE